MVYRYHQNNWYLWISIESISVCDGDATTISDCGGDVATVLDCDRDVAMILVCDEDASIASLRGAVYLHEFQGFIDTIKLDYLLNQYRCTMGAPQPNYN
jgi:hypothetical protein